MEAFLSFVYLCFPYFISSAFLLSGDVYFSKHVKLQKNTFSLESFFQRNRIYRTKYFFASSHFVNFTNDNDLPHFRSQRWILLVDDEASIRDAVGQLLANSGYQVTTCQDGSEALRIALNGPGQSDTPEAKSLFSTPRSIPDAIVSDVRMPVMDGLTLLEIIRSSPQLVEVPVILLTAKGMPQDRVAGYNAGADAYIPKPFDPEELLTVIDSVIQRHERLNDSNNVMLSDLQRDLQDIKQLLLEQGGSGVGSSSDRIEATNVFFPPDERQILQLLCQGLMTKEIAEKMYMSTRRVEQLLTSMFRKVNVKNRTELVRWAISTGNVKI